MTHHMKVAAGQLVERTVSLHPISDMPDWLLAKLTELDRLEAEKLEQRCDGVLA